MGTPRSAHRATLLNDGTVLVEGGTDENGSPLVPKPSSCFSFWFERADIADLINHEHVH